MLKINYENVTTSEDLKQISTEEYQNAITLGMLEYKKVYRPENYALTRTQFKKGFSVTGVDKETAAKELYTRKFQDLSDTERMIIACEFMFPTESFINALVNKGYDYVKLFSYTRLIRGLKKLVLEAKDEDINSQIKLANVEIEKICKLMEQYFGIKNYDYTLSKLCQVVWFEQQQFLSLRKQKTR